MNEESGFNPTTTEAQVSGSPKESFGIVEGLQTEVKNKTIALQGRKNSLGTRMTNSLYIQSDARYLRFWKRFG